MKHINKLSRNHIQIWSAVKWNEPKCLVCSWYFHWDSLAFRMFNLRDTYVDFSWYGFRCGKSWLSTEGSGQPIFNAFCMAAPSQLRYRSFMVRYDGFTLAQCERFQEVFEQHCDKAGWWQSGLRFLVPLRPAGRRNGTHRSPKGFAQPGLQGHLRSGAECDRQSWCGWHRRQAKIHENSETRKTFKLSSHRKQNQPIFKDCCCLFQVRNKIFRYSLNRYSQHFGVPKDDSHARRTCS